MNFAENVETREAVIVTGGRLGAWALEEIRAGDYLIGADSGAEFLVRHGIAPDLALGDFDSVPADRLTSISAASKDYLAVDPVDKDWTDTELALREALDRGYSRIRILGGLGSRFDHSLANVHLLRQAFERGGEAVLIDEHNEIRLCADACRMNQDPRYPYVSLLPLTPVVTGVNLTGFRYPLNEATLTLGWSLGVSNVLDAPSGTVSIREGQVLVIRSRD
ncbi:thiamine diphosphokinase [Cohnella sp. CFH 77786]|uniref:thiamine diphosphokinase n=1 Tax=Cohnella sp. CFH 77786 TaxID=2662265 RepID=UPI001C60A64C|nr:thiamine diphosphokinase [Cohnella sp. CFH 77786]MBW5448160.1 thiamine diphosphokinase [Cohnella sp. CFH 77786]